MRIQSVQTFTPKINFKSSQVMVNPAINPSSSHDNDNKDNHLPQKNGGCASSIIRNAILAICTYTVLADDPTVKNLIQPYDERIKDEHRTEYFEKVHELGDSTGLYPAVYHLNRIVDVDDAEVTNVNSNRYKLKINLDNKTINTTISLTQNENNTISGYIRADKWPYTTYDAVFSKENPQEFEIHMHNANHDKYTFGRLSNGEFYQVVNGEKVILNKKNVEKYQENLKELEREYDDLFLHKISLIMLMFLYLNAAMHSHARNKKN